MNRNLDRIIPELGMEVAEEASWKIVNLSRGLPGYVHNLGRYSVAAAVHKKRLNITSADVDLAMANVQKLTEESNAETYYKATHSNKSNAKFSLTLLACALARCDYNGYFAPLDVVQPLSTIRKKQVTIGNFQKHLEDFMKEERGGILVRRGTGKKFRYRFKEPVIQPIVIMKGISDGVISVNSKSLLSYNPQRVLSI